MSTMFISISDDVTMTLSHSKWILPIVASHGVFVAVSLQHMSFFEADVPSCKFLKVAICKISYEVKYIDALMQFNHIHLCSQ